MKRPVGPWGKKRIWSKVKRVKAKERKRGRKSRAKEPDANQKKKNLVRQENVLTRCKNSV